MGQKRQAIIEPSGRNRKVSWREWSYGWHKNFAIKIVGLVRKRL